MLKLWKLASAFVLLLVLSACGSGMESPYDASKFQNPSIRGGNAPGSAAAASASVKETGTAYAAVITAKQTPEVDRVTRGRSGDQYIFVVRDGIRNKKEGFQGVVGATMVLSIMGYDEKRSLVTYASQACTTEVVGNDVGRCTVQFPLEKIPPGSFLCVKAPWPIAGQQQKAKVFEHENVNCADGAGNFYVIQKRGRSQPDQFMVVAIQAGG